MPWYLLHTIDILIDLVDAHSMPGQTLNPPPSGVMQSVSNSVAHSQGTSLNFENPSGLTCLA